MHFANPILDEPRQESRCGLGVIRICLGLTCHINAQNIDLRRACLNGASLNDADRTSPEMQSQKEFGVASMVLI